VAMADGLDFVTCDLSGRLLRWRDNSDVVHAVETARSSARPRISAWWTRCGRWTIARSEAWGGGDDLTCPACRTIERDI
jgi:hypothetical protein